MSHSAADLPCWLEIYRKAFPSLIGCHDHREDGWHQRNGIDRSIILQNGKTYYVDEKVRGRNKKTGKIYTDIALEYWSDEEAKTPGWVCKQIWADYIAYAIAPIGKAYLLPVPQLQHAWKVNGGKWIKKAKCQIRAENKYNGRHWVTVSVGVPVNILFSAIGSCLRVEFERIDYAE